MKLLPSLKPGIHLRRNRSARKNTKQIFDLLIEPIFYSLQVNGKLTRRRNLFILLAA